MTPRIPILNMFGPSPLKPLQTHMDKAYAAVKQLHTFFEHVLDQNWTKAEQLYNQISKFEKEADNLKKDIRLNLPRDYFLPVSRNDLLIMLVLQDRIANKAKDIAGLVLGRQMQFPEQIKADYVKFLNRCIDAAHQAQKAISELDELLETGFAGKEAQLVEEMIVQLDKIEYDTDEMQIKLRRTLFNVEQDHPAVDIIFLYKIIEWTGDLADRAQTVGGQLELLLAH